MLASQNRASNSAAIQTRQLCGFVLHSACMFSDTQVSLEWWNGLLEWSIGGGGRMCDIIGSGLKNDLASL